MFRSPTWPPSGWREQEYKYNYNVSKSLHRLQSHSLWLKFTVEQYSTTAMNIKWQKLEIVVWSLWSDVHRGRATCVEL